jgi:hypothetical protein
MREQKLLAKAHRLARAASPARRSIVSQGEPDMPPGPRRMHRVDVACADYALDLVARAA